MTRHYSRPRRFKSHHHHGVHHHNKRHFPHRGMHHHLKNRSSDKISSWEIIIPIGVIIFILCGFVYLLIFASEHTVYYRNPTYQEMVDFVAQDTTDSNTYSWSNYTCENFAHDVIEHAKNKGYQAGYVRLDEPGGYGHAIVCFKTEDKGLYFLEPQLDFIFPQSRMDDMIKRGVYDIEVKYGSYTAWSGEYFYMNLSGYHIDWSPNWDIIIK